MLAMSRFEFGKKKVAPPPPEASRLHSRGGSLIAAPGSKPVGARLKGWDCFIFIVAGQQL